MREELGVITYFSLAAGFLTGKYRIGGGLRQEPARRGMKKYLNPRGLRILAALDAGRERDCARRRRRWRWRG